MVQYLIEYGVYSRINYAFITNNYLNIMKYLMQHIVNIHVQKDLAMKLAIELEYWDITRYLLQNASYDDYKLTLDTLENKD